MRTVKLTPETRKEILTSLLKRSTFQYGSYMDTVNRILEDIREKGDEALFAYTEKFDHVKLTKETVRVTPEEKEEGCRQVDPDFLRVLRRVLG